MSEETKVEEQAETEKKKAYTAFREIVKREWGAKAQKAFDVMDHADQVKFREAWRLRTKSEDRVARIEARAASLIGKIRARSAKAGDSVADSVAKMNRIIEAIG